MKFKQAVLLACSGLAICLLVIGLGLWSMSCDLSSTHPTDEKLLRDFPAKEADFNRLLGMSNEDAKVIRVAYDFTRLDNDWSWPRPNSKLGFSTERWDEYRDLFARLRLPVGIERAESKDGVYVYFPVSTSGPGNGHGSSKGYAYLEKELRPLLDSLDDQPVKDFYAREKPEHQLTLFLRIKGNWYIYRD